MFSSYRSLCQLTKVSMKTQYYSYTFLVSICLTVLWRHLHLTVTLEASLPFTTGQNNAICAN